MAGLKNNPTFNKNTSLNPKASFGFHTRTIFSFVVGDTSYSITSTPWTDSGGGDGIDDIINSYGVGFHGDAILPGKYWRPGKSIRIKGTFNAEDINNTGDSHYLNLRFGLKEMLNETTTTLAIQNNNNNHVFTAAYTTADLLTVNFYGIISCHTSQDPGIDPPNIFCSYGYYRYTVGNKLEPRYVPVWNTTWETSLENDYYDNNTRPLINCYGTNIGTLKLTKLSIEELA